MKNIVKLLLLLALSGNFLSCSDDDSNEVLPEQPNDEQTAPHDNFVGKLKSLTLPEGLEKFHSASFICSIMSEDGSLFTRSGTHTRFNSTSTLAFDQGLKQGTYQLLELRYPEIDEERNDTIWEEYGIGCTIEVAPNEIQFDIVDPFNKELGFFGEGTAEHPFKISSGAHLLHLSKFFENKRDANKILPEMHFEQRCDIDMSRACTLADVEFGWLGIGRSEYPFRSSYDGSGFTIRNLVSSPINTETNIKGRDVFGAGLFAYTIGANLYNVHISHAFFEGDFGVGGIVGCAMTDGHLRALTSLIKCSVDSSEIKGVSGSAGIGGIMGATDLNTPVLMDSCFVNNSNIEGHYAVGGLFGIPGQYSTIVLDGCSTNDKTTVEAKFASVGGLVGAADSLAMTTCINSATVKGGTLYTGTADQIGICSGGLVGGVGTGHINACINKGNVEGYEGVGGLVGSTRLTADEKGNIYLGNINIVNSMNQGYVKGVNNVGGICGEAQFSGYCLLNEGNVCATGKNATVGGIVANTSACALHNAINKGVIQRTTKSDDKEVDFAGGIVGSTQWASLYACQNFGRMEVESKFAGGIAGQAGAYSIINSCANFADIHNNSLKAKIGGIAGSVGASQNWVLKNKLACVMALGSMAYSVVSPFISIGFTYIFNNNKLQRANTENVDNYSLISQPVAPDFTYNCLNDYIHNCAAENLNTDLIDRCKAHNLETAKGFEKEVGQLLAEIRTGFKPSYTLQDDLLGSSLMSEYAKLQNTKLQAYQQDNGATVNQNINIARENRLAEVEHIERMDDIAHSVVKGLTLVTSTVLLVASFPASSIGGAFYSIMLAGSAVNGIVSGTNKMVNTLTDYESNVDIISQCVNAGSFHTQDKNNDIGGIVGCLENYGTIEHCLNIGNNLHKTSKGNSYQAGICGNVEDRTIVTHNINVSTSWFTISPICGIDTWAPLENSDNYQYIHTSTEESSYTIDLNKKNLCNIDQYSNEMDIHNDHNGTWYLSGENGSFPIPCHSFLLK